MIQIIKENEESKPEVLKSLEQVIKKEFGDLVEVKGEVDKLIITASLPDNPDPFYQLHSMLVIITKNNSYAIVHKKSDGLLYMKTVEDLILEIRNALRKYNN